MATTRFWKIKSNLEHVIDYVSNTEKTADKKITVKNDLEQVLHYAVNPDKTEIKTEKEEKLFVTGINCNHLTAYQEMRITKQQWNKEDGTLAWHGYMSFKPGEVTPQQAHEIGIEFAEKNFPGFQVVVGTHLNTGVIHNHFVVNSVSFMDGHRAHDEVSWFKFHKLADEIVKSHSLSVVKNPRRNKEPTIVENKIKDYYKRADAVLIKEAVDKALAVSTNMVSFRKELSRLGYNYNLSPNRKYWTVSPKGGRSFRLYHLGEDYTNASITQRLAENQKKIIRLPPHQGNGSVFAVLKKYGGSSHIIKLYRYYLYVLYHVQDNRKESTYIPHHIRKDVMQLNRISEEARYLEKINISEASELISHMSRLKSDMTQLESTRCSLRNKIRRKGDDTDTTRLEIETTSQEIRNIRKQIGMCENILKRSKVIADNIAVMEQQEGSVKDECRSRNSKPDNRDNLKHNIKDSP